MDEDELAEAEHKHRHVDGAQLPPQRKLEIQRILDTKYVFPCFNILVYAQNHILKVASSEKTSEQARDDLYKLYELALKLDPKPERPEPTVAQIQMINRARSFVTMRMKNRQKLREFKASRKEVMKMRDVIGSKMSQQINELRKDKETDEEDNF